MPLNAARTIGARLGRSRQGEGSLGQEDRRLEPKELGPQGDGVIVSAVSAVILSHAFSATHLRSAIKEPPMAATCGIAR